MNELQCGKNTMLNNMKTPQAKKRKFFLKKIYSHTKLEKKKSLQNETIHSLSQVLT